MNNPNEDCVAADLLMFRRPSMERLLELHRTNAGGMLRRMINRTRTYRLTASLGMLSALFATSACASHTRPSPALSNAATTQPASASTQKDFLSRTADATWDVVSAPARLLTPTTGPKPTTQPAAYEAPDVIFISPR